MKKENIKTRCINSQQYDLDTLFYLCKLTDKIKKLDESEEGRRFLASLLDTKRAMLYFNQPSTRTFLSFQNACYMLGVKTSEIRDIHTSSYAKGETELDSVKTFSQYVDLIIMRHPEDNFINVISDELNNGIRIINAGSGTDQHPTQALLDFYTIYQYGLDNKKVGFVGDLLRGRTVRSLALLLNQVGNVKLYFIAPKDYQIKNDILEQLKVDYEIVEDFNKVMSDLDVVYMTRLQKEYGGVDPNVKLDREIYSINENNIDKFKKNTIIMHPLPRVDEISVAIDKDERAKYWEQVKNGMWIRAALIASMFEKDEAILKKEK